MKKYIYYQTKHISFLLVMLASYVQFLNAQGFSPETQSRLQKAIEGFQNNQAQPFVGGISVAVKVDGLAFWQGTTGYAARNIDDQNNLLPGGTPFTTATLSRIYSVTKTFTAVLVLELANDGVFSLEDPISKYLPLMNLYNPNLDPSVTIRQLLAHESGYSDWEENMQLQIAIAFDPTKKWTPYELIAFTNQDNPPGTVRRYSHNNYVFLGAIIEAATGRPVEELYRERFFEPLGLSSMYFAGREPIGNRGTLAAPHDNISPFNQIFLITGQPTFPNAYTNISRFPFTAIESLDFTGGGIISNAADLAKWGNALFTGKATSKSVLDMMLNSIYPIPDEFGNKLGYGLKNTPFISGDYDFIGHNGSAPGYRSAMFFQPEKKLTLVVLTNFAGVSPYDIAKALYEALPDFTGGNENRKEAKIILCFKGKDHTVARPAAPVFIKKGADLGGCEGTESKKEKKSFSKSQNPLKENSALKVFPNPSKSKITFSFKVEESGMVNISLFDLSGRLVAKLYNGNLEKGTVKQVQFDAVSLPAGIYIGRMQTATKISQQKLVIEK
jgi:CubicO group peptidase (beta-lactamase class C family)